MTVLSSSALRHGHTEYKRAVVTANHLGADYTTADIFHESL